MQVSIKNIAISLVLLLVVIGLVKWCQLSVEVRYGPGVFAPDEPQQELLSGSDSFLFNDYNLTPVANFDVHARVLSRRDYSRDRESDLSPIDLALGWGPMSDESIIGQIQIRQAARFYMWRARELPISRNQIDHNSSNMHLIPASPEIERAMKRVRKGDLVQFRGKLVNAESADGWRWRTSTSRTDTGSGACELVFVEEFEIVTPDL